MNRELQVLRTPHLGEIEWQSESVLDFPSGLPGFERERRMIPVEIPTQRPLVYLQSLDHPEVCFLTLPARTIRPDFEVHFSEEERAALGFEDSLDPVIGNDLLCLALLLPVDGTVQTNLGAPVVVNLHNLRGYQVVSPRDPAACYRLGAGGVWEALCS